MERIQSILNDAAVKILTFPGIQVSDNYILVGWACKKNIIMEFLVCLTKSFVFIKCKNVRVPN